jgi:hypothetical protein
VNPGAACKDSFDCAETDFCEPTLGKCLPQPSQGPACEYRPPALPFDPLLEWSWTGSTIAPAYDQVLSIPLVADLDGDAIPEVVVVTHDTGDGSCDSGFAYIRALDGRDGKEKWGPGGFNSYRVSSQGAGAYNAPDLVVDLSIFAAGCPQNLTLRARVTNQGSLGVPAGVELVFLLGATPPGTELGKGKTTGALLPGQSEVVEYAASLAGQPPPWAFRVTVDGNGASAIDECLEDNNQASIDNVTCPTVK